MAVIIKIYCNQCLGETNHEPVRVYEQLTAENETVIWQIVRCNGCETPSFYREHRSETEHGFEIIGQALFPSRLYRKPKHFVDAPANLDEVYKETIDCFNRRFLSSVRVAFDPWLREFVLTKGLWTVQSKIGNRGALRKTHEATFLGVTRWNV